MKATWVSKMGCWESLLERNKQTLRKEKARKRKIKKTKILMFSKQGLMDKKQRKNRVLKGKTKGKPEKKIKQEDFFDRPFGDTKKNTLKLQENNLLGFPKKTKKNKPPNNKKHLFACWQTPPIFGKFWFFQVTLFYFCKAVFAENTIKKCFQQNTAFRYHRV